MFLSQGIYNSWIVTVQTFLIVKLINYRSNSSSKSVTVNILKPKCCGNEIKDIWFRRRSENNLLNMRHFFRIVKGYSNVIYNMFILAILAVLLCTGLNFSKSFLNLETLVEKSPNALARFSGTGNVLNSPFFRWLCGNAFRNINEYKFYPWNIFLL